MVTSWPGTDEELRALQNAVNRNCTCNDAEHACPAHKMLTDQDVLNHLAFVVEWRVQVLEREEWRPRSRRRA